jgi:hypothetical protein
MMKRTFLPIEKFPAYNDEVDRLMVQSHILNSGSFQMPSYNTILWDHKSIQYHLTKLTGEASGFYIENKEKRLGSIPAIDQQLAQFEMKFEKYKKSQIAKGYDVPGEEMPREMLNEFYLLHARKTLFEAEVEQLQKMLLTFTNKEKSADDAHVLKYGLRGVCKLKDDQLIIIDGQKVRETAEGIMIIFDKRSPYHLMRVSDYRRLCTEWQKARRRKGDEQLKQLQAKARAEGRTALLQLPVSSPRTVSRTSLPLFPTWAKPYVQNEPAK